MKDILIILEEAIVWLVNFLVYVMIAIAHGIAWLFAFLKGALKLYLHRNTFYGKLEALGALLSDRRLFFKYCLNHLKQGHQEVMSKRKDIYLISDQVFCFSEKELIANSIAQKILETWIILIEGRERRLEAIKQEKELLDVLRKNHKKQLLNRNDQVHELDLALPDFQSADFGEETLSLETALRTDNIEALNLHQAFIDLQITVENGSHLVLTDSELEQIQLNMDEIDLQLEKIEFLDFVM